jgi:hypothetical protein
MGQTSITEKVSLFDREGNATACSATTCTGALMAMP